MTKYWIVWNESKSEGFITDDEGDAKAAKTGKRNKRTPYSSTLGDQFFECYGEDNCRTQVVEFPFARSSKLS